MAISTERWRKKHCLLVFLHVAARNPVRYEWPGAPIVHFQLHVCPQSCQAYAPFQALDARALIANALMPDVIGPICLTLPQAVAKER